MVGGEEGIGCWKIRNLIHGNDGNRKRLAKGGKRGGGMFAKKKWVDQKEREGIRRRPKKKNDSRHARFLARVVPGKEALKGFWEQS